VLVKIANLTGEVEMMVFIHVMFLVVTMQGTPGQPDFSGKWFLTDALTRSSNVEVIKQLTATEKEIVIKQTPSNLSIDRHQTQKTTENYSLDKRTTGASWVGERLVLSRKISVTVNNQTTTMDAKEVWGLSEDRKTMTIDLTVTTPQGNAAYRLVYTK
jgi:hypothetical protein